MLRSDLIFSFEADVFMCERSMNKDHGWNLRLLSKGRLLDAKVPQQLSFEFCNNDEGLFTAIWKDDQKSQATILTAQLFHQSEENKPYQYDLFD